MSNDQKDNFRFSAKLLASFAGSILIATAMFLSVSNMAIMNNNDIAIENAKFELLHNISMENHSKLNTHIGINNNLGNDYGLLTAGAFTVAIICILISALFWFKSSNLKKK